VTIHDPSRAEPVRDALEQVDVDGTISVVYELDDDSQARRAATAAALAEARADAQDYADAMHMRVARIVRVSERMGQAEAGWTVLSSMMMAVRGARDSDVRVDAHVAVDFALAPQ
jgi:uncharacterized protein YggE